MEFKTTPFNQQISYLGKGSVNAEATEELAKLVQAVRETGKKAS